MYRPDRTEAVLYAVLDAVVDGEAPVVAALENDIDEIATGMYRGDPQVSWRIYRLSRELLRDILTVNATLVAKKQNEEMKSLTVASHKQDE